MWPKTDQAYVTEKISQEWTPDVIARRKNRGIATMLYRWYSCFPKHLFKTITFDCGKELSNWWSISNRHDLATYFADPGTPSQRG